MKLFRRTTSHPWPPAWRLDAAGTLWRLKFSNTGLILGEARDLEAKTSWFFCCDESDGRMLWTDLRLEEPWWVGLEDIDGGRFYLHGFRKPDMPQHVGIYAFDLESGAPLWRNEELAFLFAIDGSVYASQQRFDGVYVLRLSPDDGSVVEELGQQNERVNTLRAILNEQDSFAGYRYPEHFHETHPEFSELHQRVHTVVDPAVVAGNLDMLHDGSLLFLSWHEALPGRQRSFKQEFAALHVESGTLLFQDTIVDDATATGVDSFFVKDNQLFYIKNYRTLTSHDLASVPV
ncbi:MAG: DUF4905 domain-containing protein [Bacteroidetes bacterium]|nr:DUF4905 domain-containing protein [Bacteroidota bacterium]